MLLSIDWSADTYDVREQECYEEKCNDILRELPTDIVKALNQDEKHYN